MLAKLFFIFDSNYIHTFIDFFYLDGLGLCVFPVYALNKGLLKFGKLIIK